MNESKNPRDLLDEAIIRVIENISSDVKAINALKQPDHQKSEKAKEFNWPLWLGIVAGAICIGGIAYFF